MRTAIYRILYGEDFIDESIASILDSVDKIYVFWTNKVWGGCESVVYNGEEIKFPERFDDSVDKVKKVKSDKIQLVEDYYLTPQGQHTYLTKKHDIHGTVLLIEPDQIMEDAEGAFNQFEQSEFSCAAVPQIEYWKTREYRIPDRNRPGPILWKTPLPPTAPNGMPYGTKVPYVSSIAHNYGFCVSEKVMYWKHLTALAFSSVIGDSLPREEWYEDVWKKWTPDMKNLEISKNYPAAIPYAYKIR